MSGLGGRWRRGLAAAALAALTVLSSALPAMADGLPSVPFGLSPYGGSAPYFTLNVAPGHSVTTSALLSNPSNTTEKLIISRSTGVTAGNGGTAFRQAFGRCSGVGCWITDLSPTVTLLPGTGERVQFTVTVPRGTKPGQYLAGVTAEEAAKPKPVKVRANGKANGRVIILDQVTVAVAVTVGMASKLTTRLEIPGVSAIAIGSMIRLNIDLANAGQTFAHGNGTATCGATGQRRTYKFYASTVLPKERAVIAANLLGLAALGTTVPCTVRIGYADHQTAIWSGMVTMPAAATSRVVHTGLGAYSSIPAGGIPPWATALIVIGVLLLAAAVVLLVRVRGRGPTSSNTE